MVEELLKTWTQVGGMRMRKGPSCVMHSDMPVRARNLAACLLVSWGCCDKAPWRGWFKKQEFISQFWKLGSPGSRCQQVLLRTSAPFLACGRGHPAVPSHGLPSGCAEGERECPLFLTLFYRTRPVLGASTP